MEQKTIVLNCEMISPTILRGINKLELREASFKGVFRFWWRALHGNISSISKMAEKEGKIFGKNGELKSPLRLRINSRNLRTGRYPAKPHKPDQNVFFWTFTPNNRFQLILTTLIGSETSVTSNYYENVIKISLLLGGVGARSRRGFGSIHIEGMRTSLQDILHLMNSINNNFEMKDNKIVVRNLTNLPFPYIQTVELGKKYRDVNELLKKIGSASSRYNSVYTGFIGNMIKQRGKRMASPVYVSIIRDGREFRPIVTTLNYVFEMDVQKLIENPGSAGLDPKLFRNTIEEFKEAIL